MKVFDQTLELLQRSLDVRLDRHELLAGNLANVNTPGFVPRDLDFKTALAQTTSESASMPIPPEAINHDGQISLAAIPSPTLPMPIALPGSAGNLSPAGLDGNRVDADRAMTAITENALQYGAAAKAATKKLAILRYVASDGAA